MARVINSGNLALAEKTEENISEMVEGKAEGVGGEVG
eukprot:CAMPEP_0168342504 /NCGR_PEP_ID=MMETSP0213-20121227/15437_1 /TAXON_ID=151035 /ORGANISM="Euplotes harpa, Strain FSP1.4" /LENGTH=36 /DNA_ID= /DNA_START= /DNA_END= /DNA_ORIENTATION=